MLEDRNQITNRRRDERMISKPGTMQPSLDMERAVEVPPEIKRGCEKDQEDRKKKKKEGGRESTYLVVPFLKPLAGVYVAL